MHVPVGRALVSHPIGAVFLEALLGLGGGKPQGRSSELSKQLGGRSSRRGDESLADGVPHLPRAGRPNCRARLAAGDTFENRESPHFEPLQALLRALSSAAELDRLRKADVWHVVEIAPRGANLGCATGGGRQEGIGRSALTAGGESIG